MASKTAILASASQPRRQPGPGQEGRRQLKQQHTGSSSSKPKPAYSVATPRPTRPATVPEVINPEDLVHPVQQQPLDEPLRWPELEPPPHPEPTQLEGSSQTPHSLAASQVRNSLRLPVHSRLARGSAATAGQRALQHGATPAQQHRTHRHPPVAPEDPAELLKVLQAMDPPRRRVVIFKGGGYIYAEMEALIEAAGLGHVMRLTNLMRKAHCIVAKERRDTGKRVNLAEHVAAARNASIPFLLIERLDAQELVGLLRPLLVRKRIVVEHPQLRRKQQGSGGEASGEAASD